MLNRGTYAYIVSISVIPPSYERVETMNEYMENYVPTGCDYCGGDKATNLTDMGDVVCDPCLIGRPDVAPTVAVNHDAHAAELWIHFNGDEFVMRAIISNLLRHNEELRAAIAALPADIVHMTVTD